MGFVICTPHKILFRHQHHVEQKGKIRSMNGGNQKCIHKLLVVKCQGNKLRWMYGHRFKDNSETDLT
jgi:hypothetical protein